MASSTNEQLANIFYFHDYAKWQVLQTNSLQTSFIFIIMPSGKFYKRTACKHLLFPSLCQVASSTNEQLANTFYFPRCAKRQVLQTNNLQTLFYFVPSGKFYKRKTCKYLYFYFVPSGRFYKRTACKPFSPCAKRQILQMNNLQTLLILCQATNSTNEQLTKHILFSHVPNGRFYKL